MDQIAAQSELFRETRKVRVLMGNPGGNASKGASYYRVGLPPVWAQQLGVTPDDRDILLSYDGQRITIEKI